MSEEVGESAARVLRYMRVVNKFSGTPGELGRQIGLDGVTVANALYQLDRLRLVTRPAPFRVFVTTAGLRHRL